ncbi:uncharacterized protein CcaverHIS019_0607740 [Cutaneotrichosporon cavernicola]|uniref:F-box domain-containing protein n=1 Tax=Cutaneotrichosporon cavernicola TaxID=279322 RepID=A0AA48L9C7_9TREE|nr:uncharacterized protein CcaverHIS019_0607740 [Cutaneotrichosporon cavernicola]BEI94315.1 hypothetical protein CcaverHIS019_0607740 [Cutaneotrichosporon cavernicola]BEJ02092.1 hypothetical protein CcaverHIS631_0607740 [Cutaneotrichosporon cavernicola]BEJ09855.1 hypothetical protein CcaverHIS641_0607700 [Cutaneotrichosporon cavernicola]
MTRTNPKRRCVRPFVATRVPSPSPSPSPALTPQPPEDNETAAVVKYLEARGFTSALAALIADLANEKTSEVASSSTASLVWGNDDIVAEIVSFLGMSDLRTCLTISKTFCRAAAPRLYKCLRVQLLNCYCRPPPNRDMDLVTRCTTAVELFPHQHVQHFVKPLDVPRIRTLVLNYDPNAKAEMMTGKGSSLHMCRLCPNEAPKAPRVVVRPIAGLFRGRKPATVILVPTSDARDTDHTHHASTIAPETVVHIARMTSQTKYSRPHWYWKSPRTPQPNPSRAITFVLLPIMWDHGPVGNRRPPWGEAKSIGNLGTSLIVALSEYALQFGDHRITIVGLEDANPFAKAEHWDARVERRKLFEDEFRETLEGTMLVDHRFGVWNGEEREWRCESITLTTFADYLRSGAWGEEMDWQLVGRWLNSYELRECNVLGTLAPKPKTRKGRGRKRKIVSHDSDAASDNSEDEDYMV